ncbi:nucleotidyltransferase family protein [bacterium]|nr:nucleotidyltransferase family protein [bacterium]
MGPENTNQIKQIKDKILPVLKKYGIVCAGIFGSVARGEADTHSDVDILIQIPANSNMSLLDLAGMEMKLEEILKRKVDLLTYNSIHHLLKEKILAEEVRVI